MPRPPMSQDMYITKALGIHHGKYSYQKTKYVNMRTNITVTCPLHGDFNVLASNHVKVLRRLDISHLSPTGCPECGKAHVISRNIKGRKTTDQFVSEAEEVHEHRYLYHKVNYTTNYNKVEIICERHGSFFQQPVNHLRGTGCPRCKNSRGQTKIARVLSNKGIEYFSEYSFEDCLGESGKLKFDFFIPSKNLLIEYDGEQHFKPVRFHDKMTHQQATDQWKKTQKYDSTKTSYARERGISLLRINYKQTREIERLIEHHFTLLKNGP